MTSKIPSTTSKIMYPINGKMLPIQIIGMMLNRVNPSKLNSVNRNYLNYIKNRVNNEAHIPLNPRETYKIGCLFRETIGGNTGNGELHVLNSRNRSARYKLNQVVSFLMDGSLNEYVASGDALKGIRSRYFNQPEERVRFPADITSRLVEKVKTARIKRTGTFSRTEEKSLKRDYEIIFSLLEDFLSRADPKLYDYHGISAVPKERINC